MGTAAGGGSPGRYWRTLRHLTPGQLLGQVRSRLVRCIERPSRVSAWRAPALELGAPPNACNGLGSCYESLGWFGRACEQYEAALKIDPHHEGAQANLSRCREEMAG